MLIFREKNIYRSTIAHGFHFFRDDIEIEVLASFSATASRGVHAASLEGKGRRSNAGLINGLAFHFNVHIGEEIWVCQSTFC